MMEDPISLETPVGDGESSYADLIEDEKADRPDTTTALNHRSLELADAMQRLNPRMQLVISQRFGLDGSKPRTLEEIGRRLGLTRERVRQIELDSLRRLANLREMQMVAAP